MITVASPLQTHTCSFDEPPKKNNAPCAACRRLHKKCEGDYPCKGCMSNVQKALTCAPSTRPSEDRLLGTASLQGSTQSGTLQFILENPAHAGSCIGLPDHVNANNVLQPAVTPNMTGPQAFPPEQGYFPVIQGFEGIEQGAAGRSPYSNQWDVRLPANETYFTPSQDAPAILNAEDDLGQPTYFLDGPTYNPQTSNMFPGTATYNEETMWSPERISQWQFSSF